MAVYAKMPRSMIFCREAMVPLFSCKYIVKPQVVDILVCF